MQQLLAPEFLSRASSAELSQLVMAEPIIAGKVLSAVNSPLYGLRHPVTSIGHAITFLGINTVRSICLQYMLAEAFKPRLAETQKCFDALWQASALASEIAVRTAKALQLANQGQLPTRVVLAFVGQLATASLLPADRLGPWLKEHRLGRARMEQEALGTNATEIGIMLMKSWELPSTLVDAVGGIGRTLVLPVQEADCERAVADALGYCCARLGEGVATGRLTTMEDIRISGDDSIDAFHLRGYLQLPPLDRLDGVLASAEVQGVLAELLTETTTA